MGRKVFWPILGTLLVALSAADAAEISVDSPWVGKPPVVTIIGEIKRSDGKHFSALVAGLPSAIVGLSSPGGDVLASIQIGEIIRKKSFTTIVPDKMTCASACGLIWLAGVKRYVWDSAKIGFHGAFDPRTMEQSGPGNAIVGAYLNKLSLSYEAVVYMTAASPTNMQWLKSDDAKRLGIAADSLNNLNLEASISVAKPDPDSKLRSEAVAFVLNFFNQWSVLPEAELLSVLALQYADSVEYNGVRKTVGDVLADEKKSLKQWSLQTYQVLSESITANCVERMLECMATGIVNWVVKSPERSASAMGRSRFSLYLGKVSPTRFVIIRQSFIVLTSQVAH